MLLIISLSTLIFATVTTKIEENRFVFWGTVLPNENISVVLDITIPRHSNAFIRCGAECSTQNNCSGMDVCEEMVQCRIWKTSFAENLNSNDTAVRNCRRFLKVIISFFLKWFYYKSFLIVQKLNHNTHDKKNLKTQQDNLIKNRFSGKVWS